MTRKQRLFRGGTQMPHLSRASELQIYNVLVNCPKGNQDKNEWNVENANNRSKNQLRNVRTWEVETWFRYFTNSAVNAQMDFLFFWNKQMDFSISPTWLLKFCTTNWKRPPPAVYMLTKASPSLQYLWKLGRNESRGEKDTTFLVTPSLHICSPCVNWKVRRAICMFI
jgi:hypothetical protein